MFSGNGNLDVGPARAWALDENAAGPATENFSKRFE